ncbi:hypothetical protein NC661_05615 [Aquibacillus koreensis]|uniref:Uncharacterized protein n=1 Tax=Aquibacillus koreensis TaxID=279446 RepID=A0A9X4AHL9_9BACI|nr:hypothetical protein [Aquibacillus koreensis]MCT2534660.1 hypothetical protein [Aquibacillus koreensis]MDC3419844.1 hypothetical protein [Aquibacillus koreensis]
MVKRQQLVNVISKGNDTIDNRLILKQNGDFELVPFQTSEDAHNFDLLDFVTRWETFNAGNDYVGVYASKDNRLIDDILDWAEFAWKEYKQKGRTKILNPYS